MLPSPPPRFVPAAAEGLGTPPPYPHAGSAPAPLPTTPPPAYTPPAPGSLQERTIIAYAARLATAARKRSPVPSAPPVPARAAAAAPVDYGGVRLGDQVLVCRHRAVDGEANWRPSMDQYIGRVGRVIAMWGADAQGCAGVHLEFDGADSNFFFRARDLKPIAPPAAGDGSVVSAIGVGTLVYLGRHRAVDGDANWSEAMNAFVGRLAVVVKMCGPDPKGCPGAQVEVDGRDTGFFFRLRDMKLCPEFPPQGWGMTMRTAQYGPVRVGSLVVIGRHRPVDGDANWSDSMEMYVGRLARVVRLCGVDGKGCPGVRIEFDGRDPGFFFRTRDMQMAHPLAAEVPTEGGMVQTNFGPLRPGSIVAVARHRMYNGADNWIQDMEQYVGCRVAVTRGAGVDSKGCPCVKVETGGKEVKYAFRIRDLALLAP
eukprot:m51a1_g12228 hypothetical protein (426) ;mRNA; r:72166-73443